MTDETKKLFDAPWIVYGEPDDYSFVIQNASEDEIATVFMTDEAKRLARLPDLYDALMEAKNEMFIMLNEWALGKSEVDYLASYRERKDKNNYEFFNEIQELLKKVRNGE